MVLEFDSSIEGRVGFGKLDSWVFWLWLWASYCIFLSISVISCLICVMDLLSCWGWNKIVFMERMVYSKYCYLVMRFCRFELDFGCWLVGGNDIKIYRYDSEGCVDNVSVDGGVYRLLYFRFFEDVCGVIENL